MNQTLTDNDLIVALTNTVATNNVILSNDTTAGTYYVAPGTILPNTEFSYPYTWVTYTSAPAVPHVAIDKVENGFIITKGYKKYVAKKAEEVLKYLKDEEK